MSAVELTAAAEADRLETERRDEEISDWMSGRGFFRAGTGMRSPRSLAEAQSRTQVWEEWMEGEIEYLGRCTVWNEMDALALAAHLSPTETAVLSLAAIEQCSLVEMAQRLDVTIHRIRVTLAAAERKCRRLPTGDLPCSAHTLFYDEVRQKRRSVYRKPYHDPKPRRKRRTKKEQ